MGTSLFWPLAAIAVVGLVVYYLLSQKKGKGPSAPKAASSTEEE